jgi:hypothetical protein
LNLTLQFFSLEQFHITTINNNNISLIDPSTIPPSPHPATATTATTIPTTVTSISLSHTDTHPKPAVNTN